MKSVTEVIIEAIFVGLILILLFKVIDMINDKTNLYFKMFLSGFLFHIIFEYTGINMKYCVDYMSR